MNGIKLESSHPVSFVVSDKKAHFTSNKSDQIKEKMPSRCAAKRTVEKNLTTCQYISLKFCIFD